VQLDNEWVVDLLQHADLAQDRLDLFLRYNFVSLQNLDCVLPTSVQLACKHYATEAASSDDLDLLKVVDANGLFLANA